MNYVLMIGFVLAAGILNQSFVDREEQIKQEAMERSEESKAQIFHVVAKCLTTPISITVGGEPVAECAPRKTK